MWFLTSYLERDAVFFFFSMIINIIINVKVKENRNGKKVSNYEFNFEQKKSRRGRESGRNRVRRKKSANSME